MVSQSAEVGPVFRALGDQTRRDILTRLKSGPSAVSTLAGAYRMSLPAFLKHLGILESAGLVLTRKRGRVRSCTLAPDGLRAAASWLAEYEGFWNDRFDALTAHLEENR